MREAAEAFGAVEDVGHEAGDNGSGMQWRVCFADTRDAEVGPSIPARYVARRL